MALMRAFLRVVLLLLAIAGAAHAETITGTLTFTHPGNVSPQTQGVISTRVEIWRLFPEPVWTLVATTLTNSSGSFNVSVPNWPGWPGTLNNSHYQVKVYAENGAARVLTENSTPGLNGTPFSVFVGGTSPIERTTSTPGQIVVFNFAFDNWAGRHFTVNRVLGFAKQFMDENRDPSETDALPRVDVQLVDVDDPAVTFFDPVTNVVRFGHDYYFSDWTLIHEYSHYLEKTLSGKFLPLASFHDGCVVRPFDGAPFLQNSAEFAWMEGFASWFTKAAADRFPSGIRPAEQRPGSIGTTTAGPMETQNASSCAATTGQFSSGTPFTSPGTIGPLWIEDNISAVLNDLTDDWISFSESWEQSQVDPKIILQIFDHEMDTAGYPSMKDFIGGWVRRGMDVGRLERIFEHLGVPWTELLEPVTLASLNSFGSAAMNPTGTASIFHRGTDGKLYAKKQAAVGSTDWGAWTSAGGVLYSTPVAVFGPAGGGLAAANLVYYRGQDYRQYEVRLDGSASPSHSAIPDLPQLLSRSAGNPIAGNLLVLTRQNGTRLLYAHRSDGAIFRSTQSTVNGPYGAWSSIGGLTLADLAGVVTPSGRVLVFHKGLDDKLYRCVDNGSGCNWEPIGTGLDSMPTVLARANTDTVMACARKKPSGRIECIEEMGGGFGSSWSQPVSGTSFFPTSTIAGVAVGSSFSLYFRQSDGTTMELRQPSFGASFVASSRGQSASAAPVVTTNSLGRRYLFIRDVGLAQQVTEETSTPNVWSSWLGLVGVIKGL